MFYRHNGTRLAVVKSKQLHVDAMFALSHVETPEGDELQVKVISYRISLRRRLFRFLVNLF